MGYDDQMNLYAYVGNDPVNMVDPTGMYGKGSGWSDEDWKKFDSAQKQAASDMSGRAASMREEASGMKEGATNSDGYSASELNSMADKLDAGAAALNDDGSGGYIANAGPTSQGGAAEISDGVGGKIMLVDTSSAGFSDRTIWLVGHESLHSAGLDDQVDMMGNKAYRHSGKRKQKNAFKYLMQNKRYLNPDHIMSQVYK